MNEGMHEWGITSQINNQHSTISNQYLTSKFGGSLWDQIAGEAGSIFIFENASMLQ